MRQGRLNDLTRWFVSSAAQSPEAGPETVLHGRDLVLPEHPA